MRIEDLLADESFIGYCRKSNAADVSHWEKYLEDYPEHRTVAEQARELYHEVYYTLSDFEQQENLLRQKLAATAVPPPATGRLTVISRGAAFWLKWSAAACILLFLGYYLFPVTSKSAKQTVYTAANGERKTLQLPDGTLMILNGGSTVSIDEGFNKSARNLILQGEGYFEVKSNANLPFIVHTPYMDVKAVGTAFNIKAYPGEKSAETILIKGLVEVTLKEDSNRKVLLQPYQKVSVKGILPGSNPQPAVAGAAAYDTTAVVRPAGAQGDDEINEIAWTQNKLVIDDHSLYEIAPMLERWYGVKVEFIDQDIRSYRFTGSFEKEELMTVLEFLKETRSFRYEILTDGSRKVKLYRK